MVRVAVIILAAGLGRRFEGENPTAKVAAPLRGIPLVRAVAMTALGCRAVSVAVVTGAAPLEVANALRGLELKTVHNNEFMTGMASSLKLGVSTVPPHIEGVIVMLADMPLVRAETLDRLIARFDARPTNIKAVVPTFDGKRGNPVLIGRHLLPAVRSLTGDEGARAFLQNGDADIEFCPVDDPGVLIDIDTTSALKALDR